MAAPTETTWPLEPHTAAKHAILQRYLGAWLPILSNGGFPQIAYIDAFAGPGSYTGGEDGSPIIALRAMMTHKAPIRAQCRFDFIELDTERAAALGARVDAVCAELGKPANLRIRIHNESFESAYRDIRTSLPRTSTPTLAFIDPFGWTGLPFSIVSEILQRPHCEVFINFMFEEINRFLDHPDQIKNFDALFGSSEWRRCASLKGAARNRCIRDAYAKQLSKQAKYVRYFEMRNKRDATDYFLFFATNDIQGLKKMKEAMWKIDEGGAFSFSDATNPDQLVIFTAEPNFGDLKRALVAEFSGRGASIEQIEAFVLSETAFREAHFKKQILARMEAEGELAVTQSKDGRKRGTFPPGTVVAFR